MLEVGNWDIEFLLEKIGPYVELNPKTSRPRLIQGLNEVWTAIDELGGVEAVALTFDVDQMTVESWIDEHFVPIRFAQVIAERLGIRNIKDLLEPTTGYHDPISQKYWPVSWNQNLV